MPDVFVLNDQDRQLLQRFLDLQRKGRQGNAGRPDIESDTKFTPEVYIIRTPSAGIPSATYSESLDTLTPSSADCEVYQVIGEELTPIEGLQRIVHNLRQSPVPGDEWIPALRDKFGRWFVIPLTADPIENIEGPDEENPYPVNVGPYVNWTFTGPNTNVLFTGGTTITFDTGSNVLVNTFLRFSEQRETWGVDQDDFALLSSATYLTIDLEDNVKLTGLAGGVGGRLLWIECRSEDYFLTLNHEDSGSLEVNRFLLPSKAPLVLGYGEGRALFWSTTDERWWVLDAKDWSEQRDTWAADQNNYQLLPGRTILSVLPTDDDLSLTGLAGGHEGRVVWIVNRSDERHFSLRHQSSLSDEGNRFRLPWNGSVKLGPRCGIGLHYSPTDEHWYSLDDYPESEGATLEVVGLIGDPPADPPGGPLLNIGKLEFDTTQGYIVTETESGVARLGFAGFTVKEVDGTPNLTGIREFHFDQADGFQVTEVSSGIARIDFVPRLIELQEDWSTDQHNYNIPLGVNVLSIFPTANVELTGIANPFPGRRVWIFNRNTNFTITIRAFDTRSDDDKRLRMPGGVNSRFILRGYQGVELFYSGDSFRWDCLDDSPIVRHSDGTSSVTSKTIEFVKDNGFQVTGNFNTARVSMQEAGVNNNGYLSNGTQSIGGLKHFRNGISVGSTGELDGLIGFTGFLSSNILIGTGPYALGPGTISGFFIRSSIIVFEGSSTGTTTPSIRVRTGSTDFKEGQTTAQGGLQFTCGLLTGGSFSGGGGGEASDVDYDSSGNFLTSNDVQGAIDEIANLFDSSFTGTLG